MRCWFCILLFFSAGPSLCGAQPAQENPRTAVILSNHSPIDFKQAVGDLSEAQGIEVIRHKDPVIHFRYASETYRINAVEMLYNRGYDLSMKNGFPIDFPLPPSRPDQEQLAAYQQQKEEWITAHPERYQEMLQSSGITVIPQEEFDLMPPGKQQNILDHPELYSIE